MTQPQGAEVRAGATAAGATASSSDPLRSQFLNWECAPKLSEPCRIPDRAVAYRCDEAARYSLGRAHATDHPGGRAAARRTRAACHQGSRRYDPSPLRHDACRDPHLRRTAQRRAGAATAAELTDNSGGHSTQPARRASLRQGQFQDAPSSRGTRFGSS